jgi:excisionase family DNA binding protein
VQIVAKGSDKVIYYSVKEIAHFLSVNEETVRRWIRDEKLTAERGVGRQGSKITSDALSKFLNENKSSMTTFASTLVGCSSFSLSEATVGAKTQTTAGSFSLITGESWISILKGKNKDERTIKLELLEKEIELENLAMKLKNEIALKQNELEHVERQISKMNEISSELNGGGKKDGKNQD